MQLIPQTRDIVLVGGGHAHALTLRMWGMRPLPGARLWLVDPGPVAAYSGMLPGMIAGHYRRDDIEIDLMNLARHAGAAMVRDRAISIDPAARTVALASGRELPYDLLSLNLGITTEMPAIPGFADHAVPAKPLGAYAERWDSFLATAQGEIPMVVIGAGLAGAELAMASAHALRARGAQPKVMLVEAGAALAELPHKARRPILKALRAQGVQLIEGVAVTEISGDHVTLADGRALPSTFTLGVAAARAPALLAQSGLALEGAFLRVNAHLQTSDPAVFGAGDCVHFAPAPRPRAGVFAVRAAPVLAHNLRAAASGGRLRRFHPQRDYLKLVSLGDQRAVAVKWGRALAAPGLWRWKDRIDRRFMAMLSDLPPMPVRPPRGPVATGALEGSKPLCAGCGAKVGGAALKAGLAQHPGAERADVLPLPGDDAAALRFGAQLQVLSHDHLRAFTADPQLMARIAAVHALGDVWAMGATPQAALAAVVIPRQSPELAERSLRMISEGFAAVLAPEGAALIGGHTTQGAEMTLGLTVTGLCSNPLSVTGARPGDALILTKPLGTGVLLAAAMQGAAPARAVAGALDQMATPQGAAARVLAPVARAMTDVTGFGLIGHLANLLSAEALGAELTTLPALPGARELLGAGHRASLAPENAALADVVGGDPVTRALLADPQTGGGLLAAVPPEAVPALLKALAETETPGYLIGQVTSGPLRLTIP